MTAKRLMDSFVLHMRAGHADKARTCLRKLLHRHQAGALVEELMTSVTLVRFVWTRELPELEATAWQLVERDQSSVRERVLVRMELTLEQLAALNRRTRCETSVHKSFESALGLPRREAATLARFKQRQRDGLVLF